MLRSKESFIRMRSLLAGALLFIIVATTLFMPIAASAQADQSPNFAGLSKPKPPPTTGSKGVKGIDVSKWQGPITWSLVAKDDVEYAFIRSTYGVKRDPYFFGNANDAHKAGIKVGAYHYARFTNEATMKQEAAAFIKQLKRVKITYPVVLDIEQTNGLTRKKLSSLCKQFMDIVAKEGYEVMIYSYQNFFRDYLDTKYFKGYSTWVANYIRKPNVEHTIWQHSSKGRIRGINGNVDMNLSYKSFAAEKKETTKKISLNRESSDAIKTLLNQQYNAGIDVKGTFNVNNIKDAIAKALQQETNNRFEHKVSVTGKITLTDVQHITELELHTGNAAVVELLQSQLFFLGFYETTPTGVCDEETKTALREYQDYYHVPISGEFDHDTLRKMFKVTSL